MSAPDRTHTRGWLDRIVWGVTAVAALGAAFPLTASWFWPAELLCHFRPYMGALLALGSLATLALRLRPQALVLGAAAVVAAWPTLLLHLPGDDAPPRGAPLRVASVNLLWGSRSFERLVEWLEVEQPEVVFLTEIDLRRRELVVGLGAHGWPHQLLWPEPEDWTEKTWGRAFVSRRPLARTAPRQPGPVLDAWIEHEGRELRLLGAHPVRPGRADLTRRRNNVLAHLSALCSEQANVLALGDLNLTECSPRYGELMERGGLRDTRAGRGRLGTWRVEVPRLRLDLGWLRLPLDHVLVGADLTTVDRRVGPELGSDHWPVLADVAWR